MGIEVRVGDKLVKLGKEYKDNIQNLIQRELEEAAREIIERTQDGLDYQKSSFDSYSTPYAKFRAKKGRAISPVNLLFTGSMLRSIRTKVQKIGRGYLGLIYVGAQHIDKARGAMKGYGRAGYKLRKFFLLSKEQLEKLKTTIRELITNA